MESTMRSLGDTVRTFDDCADAGSLMGPKCVPKSRDASKRPSVESGAKGTPLVLKSNMPSDETSEWVRVSSGSEVEEPSGEEIPSKLWERGMVVMFWC